MFGLGRETDLKCVILRTAVANISVSLSQH
jgi:hypothetical protein